MSCHQTAQTNILHLTRFPVIRMDVAATVIILYAHEDYVANLERSLSIDSDDPEIELSLKFLSHINKLRKNQIFASIEDLIDGKLVCGAGVGGFLQVVLKRGVNRSDGEKRLKSVFMDSLEGVTECQLVW